MKIHSVFLTYFDEVCKSGSIRKAAKKLFVASSAVNRQILNKEEELGVKLFKRSHNGIVLTEAGELLSQHITRTLSDFERTMAEIDSCRGTQAQGITIVGQESVVSHFLPPVFLELQKQYPGLTTTFLAASGRKLNDYLINKRADIALSFDPVSDPNIEQVASIELDVGAVVSPSHPLANRKTISLDDCIGYPLILPDDSWPLKDILNNEISKTSNSNNVVSSTSNSMEFLRSMIGKESRIGFQTIIGLEEAIREGTLIHIPLVSKNHSFTQIFSICINRHQEMTSINKSVLDSLCQRLGKYSA